MVLLTTIQQLFRGSNQTICIPANQLFALLSLRHLSFKKILPISSTPVGCRSSSIHETSNPVGGGKWHKYLSFNKRKNKNKRNTGRKWNKRSWWQSWCWANNAHWVILNTKEKNLGLYSTQLSEIIERVHDDETSEAMKWNKKMEWKRSRSKK